MSIRLSSEYYKGLVELWWHLADIQMEEWGQPSRCGVNCSRTCCKTAKTFRIAPLWPGDVEHLRDGLVGMSNDELVKIIRLASDDTTCPLWDRDTSNCTIYEFRPIMCRLYGFPITFYAEEGDKTIHVQPCCQENPLPSEPVGKHGEPGQFKALQLPMFMALSEALQAGLSNSEKMGANVAELVRILADEELARR